jgi:hypothetical protein
MRILLTAGIFAVALLFIPQPALATMCGPSGDVATVANRSVYTWNAAAAGKGGLKIDKTYIMSLAILGTYAEVNLDFPQGPIFQFWIKKSGNWTYAGRQAPKGWPATVGAKLDKMSGETSAGGKQCMNPNWKNRSSSG